MDNIRDPQDVVRTEPSVVTPQHPEEAGARSYLIPGVLLVLLLIGGVLLARSVPNGPNVSQNAPTNASPAPSSPTSTQ